MKLYDFSVGLKYGFSKKLVYVFVFFYGFLGGGKCLQVCEVHQLLERVVFSGH